MPDLREAPGKASVERAHLLPKMPVVSFTLGSRLQMHIMQRPFQQMNNAQGLGHTAALAIVLLMSDRCFWSRAGGVQS